MSLDTVEETARFHPRRFGKYMGRYLRPQSGRTALMALMILASSGLALANPQIIRYFLDTAQSGGAQRVLLGAAAVFIAFAIVQNLASVLASYLSRLVGLTATNQLSADLALHCLRLDMPFHKQHTPGELIERIDGDTATLGNFFSQFAVKIACNGIVVLGILVLLFRENKLVGLGMVVYVGLTLLVLGGLQQLGEKRWEVQRQASAEQFGYIEERISGAEEVRAAGAETYAMARLYGLMRDLLRKTRAAFVVSTLTANLTNLIYVLGYSTGLALGAVLYTRGEATLGAAYLIVNYVGMLSYPLQALREQASDLQLVSASLYRIDGLFSQRPQVASPAEPVRLPAGPLPVEFRQVSFGYEDNGNVLHSVSFAIQPGRVLGVLGRTGSGKSTLTRLLFRLYDPAEGEVRIGGSSLRLADPSDLRQRLGMVTQDVQLFQASLRENLALFDPKISSERIAGVLRELGLWEWVLGLPEGLESPLLAGGQGLSAGEAQLLAFARVFLKNPGLVILDEASSRLDPLTEMRMEQAVDRLFKGRTGVVIAHRLKTVQRADDILILEEGRVVEYGPRISLVADPQSRFSALLRSGLEEVLA
jgi:ATP-binding cassette, subfamily B, bacterial